ncbi:hypothetical protein ACFR99_07725 [Haloarchaeobius amylolyticus]|uniref:DUF7344 domain-containing protein n=1 Tax=Haloarchaeobius amylolyticus TaxID=1198296 RepID=A0ABD6BFB9_9EURY
MKTDTANANRTDADDSLTPAAIFELLCEDHRRYALSYLSRKVGAVSLADLVDWLAHRDGEPTPERIDRLTVEFHHNHLRKLLDAGVLRYDAETGTVERRARALSLDPYLELAADDDLSLAR